MQKCCHTGKSNYGLNLSIILMFLTIYGVEKRSVTAATIENQEISLIKTIEHLSKAGDYLFRTKDFKVFMV